MKSDGLKEKIQGYENYIAKNGIDETVMRAYVQACNVADQMKEEDRVLKITKRARMRI